ncbi:hypothetical protein Zmor_010741 [Zophobas morio]|uniref:Uncharacterized protein n=1 Tax=Zophobas morio TaxID=2755281 RepID=A0AA38MK58_9CUCU|nr:hypothetical protein Zmor_010741 [Zophobas morio]
MNARVEEINEKMDARDEKMNATIEEMKETMDARDEKINATIEKMNEKIDARKEKMNEKIDKQISFTTKFQMDVEENENEITEVSNRINEGYEI